MEIEEYWELLIKLKTLIKELPPEKFNKELSSIGVDNDRITKLFHLIKNDEFHHGEQIDVSLFLLKHILPNDYERLVVKERIGSSNELYEFDPVKNGQNIIKHGISFSEVVSYSQRFGTLIVPCPDEHDGERNVIFSDLSATRCNRKLSFPLPKVEEQAESYVISIVQSKAGKFRFISSRVMSRSRHKKTLKNALKNIYPNDNDAQEEFIDRCLEILKDNLFKVA
ncbi:BrnT family toxin [Shewanella algae]|uniref:BrnT family toxin n=1 Tax=Shewanella algae TaxID=38313 RepID=UPI001C55D2C8|nr:BrnT family toxin [Shewanella algae]